MCYQLLVFLTPSLDLAPGTTDIWWSRVVPAIAVSWMLGYHLSALTFKCLLHLKASQCGAQAVTACTATPTPQEDPLYEEEHHLHTKKQ